MTVKPVVRFQPLAMNLQEQLHILDEPMKERLLDLYSKAAVERDSERLLEFAQVMLQLIEEKVARLDREKAN